MTSPIFDDRDAIPIRDPRGHFSLLGDEAAPAVATPAGDDETRWQELASKLTTLKITLNDEVLARRLKNAVLAQWKGIRTDWQTKELLQRDAASGGLGLSAEVAGKVIDLLKPTVTTKVSPTPVHQFTVAELAHELPPPPPAVSTPAPDRTVNILTSPAPRSVRPRPLPAPATPSPTPVKSNPVIPLKKTVKPFIDQPVNRPVKANWLKKTLSRWSPRPTAPVAPATPTTPSVMAPTHDKVTDIRPASRLVGPIEELRQMRLVDWRALDANPARAAEKIRGKIDLIEQQGWPQRVAAVVAWQASEVHRLYLAIGKESMESGQGIQAVIKARTAATQPVLTLAEFTALAKLNNVLE